MGISKLSVVGRAAVVIISYFRSSSLAAFELCYKKELKGWSEQNVQLQSYIFISWSLFCLILFCKGRKEKKLQIGECVHKFIWNKL